MLNKDVWWTELFSTDKIYPRHWKLHGEKSQKRLSFLKNNVPVAQGRPQNTVSTVFMWETNKKIVPYIKQYMCQIDIQPRVYPAPFALFHQRLVHGLPGYQLFTNAQSCSFRYAAQPLWPHTSHCYSADVIVSTSPAATVSSTSPTSFLHAQLLIWSCSNQYV